MIVKISYNEPKNGVEWCNPPFNVMLAIREYTDSLPEMHRHNFMYTFIRGGCRFYKGLKMYLILDTGEYVSYIYTGVFPETLFTNREIRSDQSDRKG